MSEPIGEAIVLTDGDDAAPVAGVPLLLRTMLALQRAGVERLTLVGAVGARPTRASGSTSGPRRPLRPTSGCALIVGAGTVIDQALVRELAPRATGRGAEVERDGVRVRVAPGRSSARPPAPTRRPPRACCCPRRRAPAASRPTAPPRSREPARRLPRSADLPPAVAPADGAPAPRRPSRRTADGLRHRSRHRGRAPPRARRRGHDARGDPAPPRSPACSIAATASSRASASPSRGSATCST